MTYKELKAYCDKNNVELIAVSKTRSIQEIEALYNKGQRAFGENRVQEWLSKKEELPNDIRWHHIGQLQTNKIKSLIPDIYCIQSVSNERILNKIQELSYTHDVTTNVLIQFKIGKEEAKAGFENIMEFSKVYSAEKFTNINFQGVMGMASFVDDKNQIKNEFSELKIIFDELKTTVFKTKNFKTISMGMSGDFAMAVEQGSNMIRVGSLLFGKREY